MLGALAITVNAIALAQILYGVLWYRLVP